MAAPNFLPRSPSLPDLRQRGDEGDGFQDSIDYRGVPIWEECVEKWTVDQDVHRNVRYVRV
jgi:hypothetical protein